MKVTDILQAHDDAYARADKLVGAGLKPSVFFAECDKIYDDLNILDDEAISVGLGVAVATAIIGRQYPHNPILVADMLNQLAKHPEIFNLSPQNLEELRVEFSPQT